MSRAIIELNRSGPHLETRGASIVNQQDVNIHLVYSIQSSIYILIVSKTAVRIYYQYLVYCRRRYSTTKGVCYTTSSVKAMPSQSFNGAYQMVWGQGQRWGHGLRIVKEQQRSTSLSRNHCKRARARRKPASIQHTWYRYIYTCTQAQLHTYLVSVYTHIHKHNYILKYTVNL